MRNDFKMIVFKQLTISIKTHDTKINVSCSANQQNVNMTINTVGILNLSTLFGALFVFSAFIETLDFFSLSRNTSSVLHSMLNAKRSTFYTIFTHHVQQGKDPPVTLRNYQPVAWVLYQQVIDQSKANIFIKPGIIAMTYLTSTSQI